MSQNKAVTKSQDHLLFGICPSSGVLKLIKSTFASLAQTLRF